MGANEFMVYGEGANAKTVFNRLVKEAEWECGHGGYTGTIAEKDCFVMISIPDNVNTKEDIFDYANKLIREDNEMVSDKWGPAGCIKTDKGYLFFGSASS